MSVQNAIETLAELDRFAAERAAQPGLFEVPPAPLRAQIEMHPFEGARFSIAKPDGSVVYYCATEKERDALMVAIAEIRGQRAASRYRVTTLDEED